VTNRREQLVEVKYHLTSEDFCPKIIADIPVSAMLTSYQQITPTMIPKSDFLQGAQTVWIAQASSSAATIVEVSLNLVTSKIDSIPPTTLWSQTGGPLAGINFQHTDYPRVGGVSIHPTRSDFSFTLAPNVFGVLADLSATYSISCTLNVVFQNTDASGRHLTQQIHFRPLVMPGAETSMSFASASSDFSMTAPVVSPIKSGSSGMTQGALVGIIVGSCALILILSVLVVVYYRRRNSKPTTTTTTAVTVSMRGVVATSGGSSQL